MRRGIGSTILLATAAGAAASLSPLTWADATGWTPERSDPLTHLVWPAPPRNPAWLDGNPHEFRDRLVAVGNEFRTVGTRDGTVSFLRIARDARALSGQARVIDGDTLELGGARIRLHGIDAPESAQRCRAQGRLWACGREATRTLTRLVRGKQVACEERDRDRYGRIVAVCTAAGRDLNAWMVAEGWALAYRQYSRAYVATERRARSAKRGVWRGEFVPPWDWRRGKRLTGAQAVRPKGASRCNIKGNIGRSGKRICHVPGGRYYGGTRIDTSRGERWFCTESEARAAGWRRSRQ